MCDAPLVSERRFVKARKAHKCFECRRAIAIGEMYEREKGVWPDGPAEYKTCSACAALTNAVWSHPDWEWDDCLGHGEVWEMAEGLGLLSFVPYEHPVREARRLSAELTK